MAVRRCRAMAVISVLCTLMLTACTGSSTESSNPHASSPGLQGTRTAWGPVSLILPRGFTVIKSPGTTGASDTPGAGDNYAATTDPNTLPTLLAVTVTDLEGARGTYTAKGTAQDLAETARIIATGGDVTLKQTPLAGTDEAWTMEYDAASPVDASQLIHFRSVVADLGDRALIIIGQAPAGGFPGSDVAAALASIRIIG